MNNFITNNEAKDLKRRLIELIQKSVELFEPYKSLYEGARIKWEVQENQTLMTERASVSTLLPTAGRWMRYRGDYACPPRFVAGRR